MQIGFLLTNEHHKLGKAEVLMLAKSKDVEVDENFLSIKLTDSLDEKIDSIGKKYAKRLAYTQSVYEILFITKNINDLRKDMESYNWSAIYKKNFSVRIKNLMKKKTAITERLMSEKSINEKSINEKSTKEKSTKEKSTKEKSTKEKTSLTEKDLAGFIWKKINNPVVDLKNAITQIECILAKKAYLCRKIADIEKTFLERRPHLRPRLHPSSLHPKLARALVNLTGASSGDTILDPFCGTGGILIEAGLMKLKTKGYDISDSMLISCKKNLEYYKIKNFKLEKQDALSLTERYDYIVTDIPYGKSTKITTSIQKIALAFFQNMEKNLQKRAVLVVPDIIMHNEEFSKYVYLEKKLIILDTFTLYVHKHLTRHILLLEPK